MFLILSAIFSIIYYYLSVFYKKNITDPELYLLIKMVVKFASVFLLIKDCSPTSIAILFYSIGDVVIFFNMTASIIFFGVGHCIMISLCNIPQNLFFPIALSSYLIMQLLHKKFWILYYFYAILLHYIILSTFYGNLGGILFVISDVSIVFNLCKYIDWPLYYISLLLSISPYMFVNVRL